MTFFSLRAQFLTNLDGISPSTRGIGVFFGPDITQSFLERNGLKCIIRSHAEVKSGCGLSHANCYTVFSAPFEEKGIMGGKFTIILIHIIIAVSVICIIFDS